MPSISTALNKTLSAEWREYFALLDRLRPYAIWRHEEDGELRPNGLQRPPRFVAVVKKKETFDQLHAEAESLAHLITKWPPQFFDEVWGWGRVTVGAGSHAERLAAGLPADIGEVKPKEQKKAAKVIKQLEAAGHWGQVADGRLIITPGDSGISLRRGGGRAFRLQVWDEQGTALHRLSAGVVVCRGVHQGIHEGGGPRKTRKDALTRITGWGEVSFWG